MAGGHHGHAQRGADGHGDHGFFDGVAQAYASVEAIGQDVAKTVVHVELQLDVRVLVDLYDRVNLIPWDKLTSFFNRHLA